MELDEIRPELLALRDVSRKLKDENGQVLSELDEAKSEVEELINMNEDLERARLEALDDVSMMEIKSTLSRCALFNCLILTCIHFSRRPPLVNDGQRNLLYCRAKRSRSINN